MKVVVIAKAGTNWNPLDVYIMTTQWINVLKDDYIAWHRNDWYYRDGQDFVYGAIGCGEGNTGMYIYLLEVQEWRDFAVAQFERNVYFFLFAQQPPNINSWVYIPHNNYSIEPCPPVITLGIDDIIKL